MAHQQAPHKATSVACKVDPTDVFLSRIKDIVHDHFGNVAEHLRSDGATGPAHLLRSTRPQETVDAAARAKTPFHEEQRQKAGADARREKDEQRPDLAEDRLSLGADFQQGNEVASQMADALMQQIAGKNPIVLALLRDAIPIRNAPLRHPRPRDLHNVDNGQRGGQRVGNGHAHSQHGAQHASKKT
eukprot:scaffold184_cov316-Pinguiococcus_pyrenoidosus.AAC.68